MRSLPVRLALLSLLAIAGCGGGSPTTPMGPPTATTTITITASGVSANNIQIAPGSRVLFVNNDTRSHDMSSDPHPEHTDCPPINQVGVLAPGQSRETGNLVTVRTCAFHDHDLPNNQSLKGQIVIR